MGGGARFRVDIALSAIGEGLREAARDFGGASLRCVCLPLSPAGSGHPHHRFITPSKEGTGDRRLEERPWLNRRGPRTSGAWCGEVNSTGASRDLTTRRG